MSPRTVPLFDANAHPTLTGRWPTKKLDARFETLARQMRSANFRAALAVGLWGLEKYDHEKFIETCRMYPSLVPIAGYFPRKLSGIARELKAIKKMGYRGIKLHPKEPAIRLADPRMARTLREAARLKLPVFLCTYLHTAIKKYPEGDPLYDLVNLLKRAPEARVVLVHGGGVELLRYAELVRHNKNLLMDLSLTLMKYEGSRVDFDLRFLFERFDRRIAIGTDFPEYAHRDVARRFAGLSRGLSRAKRENIAFRNIQKFLK